jgi:hypothetical protein
VSAREKLPARRYSESFDVEFPPSTGKLYAVTIGCYPDGRIGEVFLSSYQKVGSQADMAARDLALLISIALQHGAPLEVMASAATKDAESRQEGLAGVVLEQLLAWRPEVPA